MADQSQWNLPADQAVDRLMRDYGGQIYRLGLSVCGNPDEAQDLVQDVFLAAYRKWDQFEGRSKPTTWLFTIATRRCQRLHRKRAGEPRHMESLDELLPFDEPTLPVLDDGRSRGEVERQVGTAIATLPEAFRVPLLLKDIVGLPVSDVAEILGLKEATVKTRLHRARLKLRKVIVENLPRETDAAPAPAYPLQVCLDLLEAKQESLDRGVPFAEGDAVICERCRSVFRTLDLGADVCLTLGGGDLPAGLAESLRKRIHESP